MPAHKSESASPQLPPVRTFMIRLAVPDGIETVVVNGHSLDCADGILRVIEAIWLRGQVIMMLRSAYATWIDVVEQNPCASESAPDLSPAPPSSMEPRSRIIH